MTCIILLSYCSHSCPGVDWQQWGCNACLHHRPLRLPPLTHILQSQWNGGWSVLPTMMVCWDLIPDLLSMRHNHLSYCCIFVYFLWTLGKSGPVPALLLYSKTQIHSPWPQPLLLICSELSLAFQRSLSIRSISSISDQLAQRCSSSGDLWENHLWILPQRCKKTSLLSLYASSMFMYYSCWRLSGCLIKSGSLIIIPLEFCDTLPGSRICQITDQYNLNVMTYSNVAVSII